MGILIFSIHWDQHGATFILKGLLKLLVNYCLNSRDIKGKCPLIFFMDCVTTLCMKFAVVRYYACAYVFVYVYITLVR